MQAQSDTPQLAPADVLIVTALREEREAVKAVMTGVLGEAWVEARAPGTELRIERRSFRAADGGELHVALICAEEMGGVQAAGVAGPVVMALRPRCLAMCGVLGGKPGDTEFGDVVFAGQLFQHDSGKRTESGFEHATRPHKLDIRWLEKARDFAESPGDALAWLDGAVWTYEQQRAWLLDQFARGRTPQSLKNILDECCPLYESIVERLLEEELVSAEGDPLTEKGKQYVAKALFKSPRWPGLDLPRRSLQVHVGALASGNAVQGDPALWNEMAVYARKTLGVEMEGYAVANSAELYQVEVAVVMKGVMDHADKHKDDRYKAFAGRGSAECLLAFLRRYLPTMVRPDFDDILSPGTATLPENPSPSQLLMPAYEVVKFYRPGRTADLAELDAWCSAGREVRGRLIHGPGGFGKTRLVIEWTRTLRERRWAAGFLRAGAAEDWFARLVAVGKPTAVVIDYAENHARLRSLLEPVIRYAKAEGRKVPVRILLLARTAGDWWNALLATDEPLRAFLSEHAPRLLEPLADVPGSRAEAFREAVDAFASWRGRPAPEMSDDLAEPAFERALYLHMAALAVVDGLDFRGPQQDVEEGLMDAILEHEERFWDERIVGDDRGRRLQIEEVRQLVVAAVLRGGFPTRAAATAVTASVLGGVQERLVMLTHDIYGVPDHGGRAGAHFGPLEPDLLGEGMVLRSFDRVNERPDDLPDRIFADEQPDAIRNGFVVLGRIATGTGVRVQPWIDRLLTSRLAERALLAFEAAKMVGKHTAFSALGDALADALQRDGDAAIAASLMRAGIPERTVALRGITMWIYASLLDALADDDEAKLRDRARFLTRVAVIQGDLGRWREALVSSEEAVRILRGLADQNSDELQAELAASLNILATIQGGTGRLVAGLASMVEVVRINRALAGRAPGKFRRHLAGTLSNLGALQGNAGQREEALDSVTEAVSIYRELVVEHPATFHGDLAMSVNGLSNRQVAMGQRKAALDSAEEAAHLYHMLAKTDPDAFQPSLAVALIGLSNVRSAVGKRAEAHESGVESVRLLRRLAKREPRAFGAHLAGSLLNLSNYQSSLGMREPALASATEAAHMFGELASSSPGVYERQLAASLNNLGTMRNALGQSEAALEPIVEAVRTRRRLADDNPDAFRPTWP